MGPTLVEMIAQNACSISVVKEFHQIKIQYASRGIHQWRICMSSSSSIHLVHGEFLLIQHEMRICCTKTFVYPL